LAGGVRAIMPHSLRLELDALRRVSASVMLRRFIGACGKSRPLTYHSNDRGRAEAAFNKVQRAQQGEKAKTEHEAEAQSVREKTSRLRSLRLAKEAADLGPSVKKKPDHST
jgi:hypothetical protein